MHYNSRQQVELSEQFVEDQQLLADARTPEEVGAKLNVLQARLDLVALLHEIRCRQGPACCDR